jgi:hypothetical protein
MVASELYVRLSVNETELFPPPKKKAKIYLIIIQKMNFKTLKRQLRLNIMWDDYLIALLTERFFYYFLCTFFKAHNYMGFIIYMKYNRYTTNNINDFY